jgi:hypothetical protein
MVHDRQVFGSTVLIAFLVLGLIRLAHAVPAAANEILTWNETAVKVVAMSRSLTAWAKVNASGVMAHDEEGGFWREKGG